MLSGGEGALEGLERASPVTNASGVAHRAHGPHLAETHEVRLSVPGVRVNQTQVGDELERGEEVRIENGGVDRMEAQSTQKAIWPIGMALEARSNQLRLTRIRP